MKVEIFHKSESLLGEGPYWCGESGTLYWVDILNKTLYAKSFDARVQEYKLPEALSCFFVSGTMVYGCTESGYCEFDLNTNTFKRLIEIESDLPSNRSNDGAFDGYQGFLYGTMSWQGNKSTGRIYYVDTVSLDYEVIDTGFYIPNGFAFNADHSEIVIADSCLGKLFKYDYDVKKRKLKNKIEIVDISKSGFSPDGMASTRSNNFWNAVWDGACLNKYDFYGRLLDSISLPVLRPTSCVFGGINMDKLFITSATEGLTDDQIFDYPYSGSVLMVETGS